MQILQNIDGGRFRTRDAQCAGTTPIAYRSKMPARQNISGSSPFEPVIGFSRAVRMGNVIHVSGTGPVGADDASVEEQARRVFQIIEQALLQAGARLSDVVRTRMYLTRAAISAPPRPW
jgi:enamine deaminase RidA (YjgF/YER057c/UK114 family)